MSFSDIKAHCKKATLKSGSYDACVDVNCYFQKSYVSCFEVL